MLGVQRLGPIIPRFTDGALTSAGAEATSPGQNGAGSPPVTPDALPQAAPASAAPPAARTTAPWTEREAWTVLMGVSGVGPAALGRLLSAFGSGVRALETAATVGGAERLDEATGGELGMALARRIAEAPQNAARLLERLRSLAIDVVTIEDEGYPARLRLVDTPPPLLFVRGDTPALNAEHMVAVVGTRWPTDKGRLVAGWIGAALANAGACVVSGLAVGVDGAAHAATVAHDGRTVAVLGGGHARLFPAANSRLADEIVRRGGAVVAELPPDTSPSRGTFPRRNRLVSGMADATIVVEAGRRSGALITAGWALEQGRECFIVPGALDAPMSAGCLAFLRSFPGQARVICGIPELVEDLGLASGAGAEEGSGAMESGTAAALATLNPAERAVAARLSAGPATLDDLVAATGGTTATTLSVLTLLELRGMVRASYGRYVPAGALARGPATERRNPGGREGP